MSHDFWMGMFAIPAVALAIALIAAAVMIVVVPFVYLSERFSLDDWKLWPKKTADYNRAVLPSIVACAKWTRYLWIPGWHIVICRTTLAGKGGPRDRERHHRVQVAVDSALRRFDYEHEDGSDA